MPEWRARLRSGWSPRGRNVVLAACVCLPEVAVIVSQGGDVLRRNWATVLVLLVAGASALARRQLPLPAALATSAAYILAVQSGSLDIHGSSPSTDAAIVGTGIAVAVLSYTAGSTMAWVGSLAAVVGLTVALQWDDLNPFPAMITIGAWLIGRVVASRRTIVATLAARALELESERVRFVEEAVRYERIRIARELHDIIAHNLSVIVIQAAAGQRLDDGAGERREELFAAIADVGRQAYDDIGGLAQLLDDDHDTDAGHRLSTQVIDELLTRAQSTGAIIELSLAGDPDAVAAPIATLAYRILEEGITNAFKHAPGAAIAITLSCDYGIDLEITNRAAVHSAAPLAPLGAGRGIVGLSERIAATGGRLHGGPTADGGWLLSASIPVTDIATQPRVDDQASSVAG